MSNSSVLSIKINAASEELYMRDLATILHWACIQSLHHPAIMTQPSLSCLLTFMHVGHPYVRFFKIEEFLLTCIYTGFVVNAHVQ